MPSRRGLPPPRDYPVRYAGVLAAAGEWKSRIVPPSDEALAPERAGKKKRRSRNRPLRDGSRACVVNPNGRGIPLLAQAGGPAPSHYLEPLEELADERPVVFYDQFGTGRSSRPEATFDWSVQLYLDDLDALRDHLGLRRIHLLGHSWGTMLLAAYMEEAPPGVESLVMVSPSVSAARWLEDAEKLRAALPPETDAVLREHEARGAFHEPAYQDAAMVFLRRHFCRLDPWPPALLMTLERMGPAFEAMWGPNEFVATGVLKDFDETDVLGTISVPTLFIGGEHDEAPPETVRWHAEMVPEAQVVIIPGASHMPMLEDPALFNETVRAFLRGAERRQQGELAPSSARRTTGPRAALRRPGPGGVGQPVTRACRIAQVSCRLIHGRS